MVNKPFRTPPNSTNQLATMPQLIFSNRNEYPPLEWETIQEKLCEDSTHELWVEITILRTLSTTNSSNIDSNFQSSYQ